jgi:hypothetical protein
MRFRIAKAHSTANGFTMSGGAEGVPAVAAGPLLANEEEIWLNQKPRGWRDRYLYNPNTRA